MKTEEIIEGNKMIAEFMGFNIDSYGKYFLNPHFMAYNASELKFHLSWDWLMPVVEKIDTLGYNVQISRISCKISPILNDESIASFVCGNISKKIEVVYSSVIQFIKWQKENIEK